MDSNGNGKQNNNSEREPHFSVNFFLDPCQGIIQCTIWGQLIKDTKFVIASHAHTITIPY